MKTKYLDTEIERLILLERNEELTYRGKEMLSELKEIKQALFIPRVSQQRELLLAYHKYLDSLNDHTVYNASESMIDYYLANNCG